MNNLNVSRRRFVLSASLAALGSSILGADSLFAGKEIVSIIRIKDNNISTAVEEAIDLLGGIKHVLKGKESILLKPNLVAPSTNCTTNPIVIGTLARLMKASGKEVMIGEGSAAADSFNVINGETFRTKKRDILDRMQKNVFDTLGYTSLAESMNIQLINLHSGNIVELPLSHGFVSSTIKIHEVLSKVDLVCSVPMMKTHTLAMVSLAMKNLLGLYPGTEYYSVRSWLHDRAAEKGSKGVAFEILDMNSTVPTGLSVIDASKAMEGDGPFNGPLVEMGLIIAGTSPLAADMVGSTIMGFDQSEIPVFKLAHEWGMKPASLEDIEIRGLTIGECNRKFTRPAVTPWSSINKFWGIREL